MIKLLNGLIVLTLFSCCNNIQQQSPTTKTLPNDSSALYKCLHKTIIIFHPDSITTKSLLDADKEMTFVETLSDFNYYAQWLEDTLKNTDIKFINTTARHLIIDNGTSQTTFDFANDNQWFGIIVSKPGVKAEVRNGIFTNIDYAEILKEYFN